MTLLVRDEEDILKENIDFHLNQGVDFIIATDNRSVDLSKEILKEYEKKGFLHYIYEPEDNYNQHAWVTKMARLASNHYKAEWVINNDADEFWWPCHHVDLKTAFASVSEKTTIIHAERKNFIFSDFNDNNTPFYKRMIYKDTLSLNPLGSPLPGKQAHRGNQNIVVKQGNHSVSGIEQVIQKNLIEIFHYPIRSRKQLTNKILKGGAAYKRNQELSEDIGSTWRALYKELKKEGNLEIYLDNNAFDLDRLNKSLKKSEILEDYRLDSYLTNLYET